MTNLHPVHLVGAGPGDPELLTLKALRVIRAASVILVDDLVGERVLEGILNDELYILTHSEFLPGVTDRANATIAAVPAKRPQNEEYKSTFAMLFNSPIWADEIARQQELKA